MRKVEVKMSGGAIVALDERGEPLTVTVRTCRSSPGGSAVQLPADWIGCKAIVIKAPEPGE